LSEIKRVCVVGAGAIGSLLAGHIGALADVEMSGNCAAIGHIRIAS
jgi:ketopantoate reductase